MNNLRPEEIAALSLAIVLIVIVSYLVRRANKGKIGTTVIQPSKPEPELYVFLGGDNPSYTTPSQAKKKASLKRKYFSEKPLKVGVRLYDNYPSSPTKGGKKWIALTDDVGKLTACKVGSNGLILNL